MENEETMAMNQPQDSSSNETQQTATPQAAQNSMQAVKKLGSHVAATAVGVGIGTASAHVIEPFFVADPREEETEAEGGDTTTEGATAQGTETTADHSNVIVTGDHLQVAHVDNSLSFSQAFAQARAQVGPGGVFAWHGKVYGTYYENEWNSMTAEERAAWQGKVDYQEALQGHEYHAHTEPSTSHVESGNASNQEPRTNAEESAENKPEENTENEESHDTTDDNEVRVVGIAIQDNGQGGYATIGQLQGGGETALVVDVESDGRLDLFMQDTNENGRIDNDEVVDIRQENMSTEAVVQDYVAGAVEQGQTPVVHNLDTGEIHQIEVSTSDDPNHLANTDDLPDYMNDADTGMMDV